ncbi:MAG: carboxylesterase/lipase family protein [Bryobacterales bacterium]|nr:carboxylesterase/lipase family protein [Bryobacterales bacterium]
MNRRRLLSGGAGLIGGTLAGLALQSGCAPSRESAQASPNLQPPIVQVKGGRLRGFRDGKTFTFLGIPYAEAERFELPKPVKPWDGVKNAQAWGPICPVPEMTAPGPDEFVFPHRYWLQNEHCQFLNVWTQSLGAGAKKPVMVWMHGGGFTNGSSMESYAYDGKNLSEYGDVVTVSLNHRLNILGTLDLSAYGPAYENSRYTGTADLVAALQWVHDNIEAFGGDPGNVTIFGQSGGGGKVVRMLLMPAAQGLFHKVIAQSGGSLNYRDTDPAKSIKTQQMIAAATLKNLGLSGNQIDKLKAVPYQQLLAAGTSALEAVAKQAGLPRAAWDVIADDKYVMREICDWAHDIPLMSGSVFSEQMGTLQRGDGRKNEWSQKEIDDNLAAAYGDKKNEIVAEFQKLFPRNKVQDVLYYAASSRTGVKQKLAVKLEKGRTPVYSYLFAYEYPVNGGTTAFHCSEIAFAFHNLAEPHIRVATGGTAEGLALQDKVATAWLNFARTGNPSQPGLEFKPYTVQDPQTMVFDAVTECRPFPDDKLISLMPPPPPRRG